MFLLETLGSGPVNCAAVTFVFVAILSIVYGTVWINHSLAHCPQSLVKMAESEWYPVMFGWRTFENQNQSHLDTLESARYLLKGVLNTRFNNNSEWSFYEKGDFGLLPSCKWLNRSTVASLESKVKEYRLLGPESWVIDNQVSRYFNHSEQSDNDIFWFLLDIASVVNTYFPLYYTGNGTIKEGLSQDFLIDCFNSSVVNHKACYPCGNTTAMMIDVSPDFSSFTDLVTGEIWPTANISLVAARCFNRIINEFIQPCEYNLKRQLASIDPAKTASLIDLLTQAGKVPADVFWRSFFNVGIVIKNPAIRQAVLETCTGPKFNVLQLLGSSSGYSFWQGTNKKLSSEISLECWQIYAMYTWTYFLVPNAPLSHCLKTPRSFSSNISRSTAIADEALNQLLLSFNFAFISNTTSYSEGYPVFPFFAGENARYRSFRNPELRSTMGHLWRITGVDEFLQHEFSKDMYHDPSCTEFVNTSSPSLEKFLSDLGELTECVKTSQRFLFIHYSIITMVAISGAVLAVFLTNILLCKVSKLHASCFVLMVTLLCSYIPSIIQSESFVTNSYDVIVRDLYLTADSKYKMARIHSVLSGWLFATFFLFNVFVVTYISTKCGPSKQHYMFAVFYFVVRGILCPFVFDANIGVVPFVNWITVIRICSLDIVLPFPYCYADIPGDSYHSGSLPFVGNLVGSLMDISAVVVYKRIFNKKEWVKKTFVDSRADILIIKLKRVMSNMLFSSVFLNGVVYTATVALPVVYIGSYTFGTSGLDFSISLQSTGVQDAWAGIYFNLFFYVFYWCLFFLPVEQGLGKLLAGTIYDSRIDFQVLQTEKSDDKVLCLEYLIRTMYISHTSYHVRLSEELAIPLEFEELGKVYDEPTDTLVWIVSNLDTIYISFRGTVSAQNAKTDLNMKKTKLDWSQYAHLTKKKQTRFLASACKDIPKCRVHRGFLKAVGQILGPLLEFISKRSDIKKFVCTGHSLGGALAALCGLFLATSHDDIQVDVCTFGSPKVGDAKFAAYFNQHVHSCFRVVQRGDPITKTPFTLPLPRCMNVGYTHVGIEVISELHGDLIIDPSVIDRALLHGWKLSGGIKEHSSNAYLIGILSFFAKNYKDAFILPDFPNVMNSVLNKSDHYYEKKPVLRERIMHLFGEQIELSLLSGSTSESEICTQT